MQRLVFHKQSVLRYLLALLALVAAATHASTYTVTSLADSGTGSLRAAIAAAAAGDTISITATGTLTLTSGEIAIGKSLNLIGPGSGSLTISGNGTSRIFNIVADSGAADAPVTLSGMTLSRGAASGTCPAPTGGSGGAILATESLTLTNVVLSGNAAARNGGALAWAMRRSGQALTLANATFSGNSTGCAAATTQALGGGLYIGYETTLAAGSAAAVTISASTFSGNIAVRSGGGIAVGGPATISINQSRIVGNTATSAYGGGVYVAYPSKSGLIAASLLLQNSEVAENTAALAGGAINHANATASAQTASTEATLALVNSTVSGNTVSGAAGNAAGIAVAGNAGLSIDNSTIAYNSLSAASSGAAVTRSACTVSGSSATTREPAYGIDSSIIAMTNAGSSSYYDLSNAGGSFATNWAITTSLVRRSDTTIAGSGNLTGGDPKLLALAFNGGSTRTHALASTSPAIDTGSNGVSLTADQRGSGFARSYGSAVDMGAFEYNPTIVTVAEFYNSALDAWFISGRPDEQYLLDNTAGFRRSGATFQAKSALASDLTAAEDAVCRYYISITSPFTSSHFYGFKATDCVTIASGIAAGTVNGFSNEGYDFATYKAATSTTCPTAAPVPVYRSFRAAGNGKTPNHRYTTSTASRDSMTAQGWTSEGIAFCTTSAATVQ